MAALTREYISQSPLQLIWLCFYGFANGMCMEVMLCFTGLKNGSVLSFLATFYRLAYGCVVEPFFFCHENEYYTLGDSKEMRQNFLEQSHSWL